MTISNGNVADAGEVLDITEIFQNYTGAGFDTSASNTTDTEDHELTAIPAANLVNATYVKVTITGTAHTRADAGESGQTSLKIQVKEIGGAYGDDMSYKVFHQLANNINGTITASLIWVHALTGGEITNGLQFKVFAQTIDNTAAATSTFTNINTFVEVKA